MMNHAATSSKYILSVGGNKECRHKRAKRNHQFYWHINYSWMGLPTWYHLCSYRYPVPFG